MLTLSTLYSGSYPPLSRQGGALAYLDFLACHDPVICTDGSIPFPFGKEGIGVLANCSLCGVEATFSYSLGPACSNFLLKPAAFFKLFAVLARTNKSAISLPFCSPHTVSLFFLHFLLVHLFFYLLLSSTFGRNYPFFLLLFC